MRMERNVTKIAKKQVKIIIDYVKKGKGRTSEKRKRRKRWKGRKRKEREVPGVKGGEKREPAKRREKGQLNKKKHVQKGKGRTKGKRKRNKKIIENRKRGRKAKGIERKRKGNSERTRKGSVNYGISVTSYSFPVIMPHQASGVINFFFSGRESLKG